MADLQVAQPLTLKCGLTLPNRLAKAAMAEGLADKRGLPGQKMRAVYSAWAKGGWGMVLTGNVQVNQKYLGGPGDPALNKTMEYAELLEVWKAWASDCNAHGTPTIVQINHPGRQSPLGAGTRGFFEKNLAPSAIPLDFGKGLIPRLINSIAFGTPRAMTKAEIEEVVQNFAETARLSAEAGFAGVEIHAAHGYLLAQFLSEKSNQRTDEYGGSPAARAKIILDIIPAIRAVVPKNFCVGIKLNSVDHQSPQEFSACREQIQLIAAAGVDFIEVSGGSYEDPLMSSGLQQDEKPKSSRTLAREAFFIEFAATIRKDLPDVPLMVTGGFRTRKGAEAALQDEGCDLIGVGRPACVEPALPNKLILNPKIADDDAVFQVKKIQPPWLLTKIGFKAIGAAADSAFYAKKLQSIAQS
ncbi:uncharacterized protein JN550_005661 [Neoarthrinium moseri]|uniref:uncharacterized protein n=1 Tax=Neoarthrinium moseri TaxID=1658444 RepID=UPI001FDD8ED4|nr:uncharacterized protein JN550_005661 [Neoarthrinium moseri]KAI1869680.1 hypothetical protein JN550_005661 [Neoarthrinium moseri]